MSKPVSVYWGSGSQPSWRVLLGLEIKRVPYESKLISFSKGEHKTAEFLRLNPRHKVPVLTHGDYALYESLAILTYLERRFPEPPLFGESPEEAGLVMRWVCEYENYLLPPLQERIVEPIFFGKLEAERHSIERSIAPMHEELQKWETAVADKDWVTGARVSAADISLYPSLMGLVRAAKKPEAASLNLGVLPLQERYPKLKAWTARIEALPGYDRTYPPHWRQG